jgi:hypothetical protein
LITAADPNSKLTVQILAGETDTNLSIFDKAGNIINTFPDNNKNIFKSEEKSDGKNKAFRFAVKRFIDRPIGISILDEQHVQILAAVHNLEIALRNKNPMKKLSLRVPI